MIGGKRGGAFYGVVGTEEMSYSEPVSRVRSIKLSFTGAKVCWACSILICVYFIFEEITRTWFSYVTILSIPVDV